jgi:SAM-dependent methyltransferase
MAQETRQVQEEIGAGLAVERMPAHWLMARLGKRVLRPGGVELTRWLLEHVEIRPDSVVVELAPGLGATAARLIARGPARYIGVERDATAAEVASRSIGAMGHPDASLLRCDASEVPLEVGAASLVVGEAMLSMQTPARKSAIMQEAARILAPGGLYAIHELALRGDEAQHALIQRELSDALKVGVRIGDAQRWEAWLKEHGFAVITTHTAPMRLLEPGRILEDEGAAGAARFILNALSQPRALVRLLTLRNLFARHSDALCAIAIVARRIDD